MSLSRRHFLAAAPAALALALQPGWMRRISLGDEAAIARPPKIGRSSTKPNKGCDVSSVTSSSTKSFRILQITDMHFLEKSGEVNEPTKLDRDTYEDCKKYVDAQKPDLIVLSGDWWFDDPHGRARATLDWAIKEQAALGVPWTFCWGNHDLANDYQIIHDLIEAAPQSLYRGGKTHGDHRLEVRPSGASAKDAPALDILLMNTSDTGLSAWQVNWYAQTRKAIARKSPSLAFFHIPLAQYNTLYDPGKTVGAKLEEVSFAKEDGKSLAAMESDGTLRACFCGHDHTNDYSVNDNKVDLVFGRATGRSGYGGEKLAKGAKVIDIDLPSGEYRQKTVFADGSTYKPEIQPLDAVKNK